MNQKKRCLKKSAFATVEITIVENSDNFVVKTAKCETFYKSHFKHSALT